MNLIFCMMFALEMIFAVVSAIDARRAYVDGRHHSVGTWVIVSIGFFVEAVAFGYLLVIAP
jgi:hypothetical protein